MTPISYSDYMNSKPPVPPKPLQPIPWWSAIIGFIAIGFAIVGVYLWLTDAAKGTNDPNLAAKLRVEVIRNALTVGAGLGGVAVLLLAFRRQHFLERQQQFQEHQHAFHELSTRLDLEQRQKADAAAEHDATERRITELRVQAVEQLGSDNSGVRIGGLHNLERLGEQYAELRQVVIDEICAYLRKPFVNPDSPGPVNSKIIVRADGTFTLSEHESTRTAEASVEKDVRRTAQLILERHLKRHSDAYWSHTRIDLSGVALDGLSLSGCELHGLNLHNANLDAFSYFSDAILHGFTNFSGTKFRAGVSFYKAQFHGGASFLSTEFYEKPTFENAAFHNQVVFLRASFRRGASFKHATFDSQADFRYSNFLGKVTFWRAFFKRSTEFQYSNFHGADFRFAVFKNEAHFSDVTFHFEALFTGIHVNGLAFFREAIFQGEIAFRYAKFARRAEFTWARALDPSGSIFRTKNGVLGLPGWYLVPSPDSPSTYIFRQYVIA